MVFDPQSSQIDPERIFENSQRLNNRLQKVLHLAEMFRVVSGKLFLILSNDADKPITV